MSENKYDLEILGLEHNGSNILHLVNEYIEAKGHNNLAPWLQGRLNLGVECNQMFILLFNPGKGWWIYIHEAASAFNTIKNLLD